MNRGRIRIRHQAVDAQDLKLRIEQAYEVYALRHERDDLPIRYRQVFDVSADPTRSWTSEGCAGRQPCHRAMSGTSKADLLRSNSSVIWTTFRSWPRPDKAQWKGLPERGPDAPNGTGIPSTAC